MTMCAHVHELEIVFFRSKHVLLETPVVSPQLMGSYYNNGVVIVGSSPIKFLWHLKPIPKHTLIDLQVHKPTITHTHTHTYTHKCTHTIQIRSLLYL